PAGRSNFNRAVRRLVSSSPRLPVVKQNRYNRQSSTGAGRASGSLASWCGLGVLLGALVGIVDTVADHLRWTAIIRAPVTARARMFVHPIGDEALAIDRQEQVL